MLYIKANLLTSTGQPGDLIWLGRFRTNAAMSRVFSFSDEMAISLFTQGEARQDRTLYSMGHTLPAEDMAAAQDSFLMYIEKADGQIVRFTIRAPFEMR